MTYYARLVGWFSELAVLSHFILDRSFVAFGDPWRQPLIEASLLAVNLRSIHRVFSADFFQGHTVLPLLQHAQFLLDAPPAPSTVPILDRFHHGFHSFLLAYETCRRAMCIWERAICNSRHAPRMVVGTLPDSTNHVRNS